MARKKVKLAYITNDSQRKVTFRKRRNGLVKKLNELSTLCDIDACSIIYSPYESQPDVWPSPEGVAQVVSKFNDIPEIEQTKKKVDQEGFISQRIMKVGQQWKKIINNNREMEMTMVMFDNLIGRGHLSSMNPKDFKDYRCFIDQYLKEIVNNIDGHMTFDPQASSSSSMTPPPLPPPMMTAIPEVTTPRMSTGDNVQMNANDMDLVQQREWINELMNNNDPPQGHVGFGSVDQMMSPSGDHINVNNNGFVSNASFFPWEK